MIRLLYIKLTPLVLLLIFSTNAVRATDELQLDILGQEFNVEQFKAARKGTGKYLLLWIDPGSGNNDRLISVLSTVAEQGIEVWNVDLLANLFIPASTNALRELDGKFVAEIIRQAHAITGRKVTLMTRAYGSLPALRGAREWQRQLAREQEPYLNGAILFSPELYSEIPPLGHDPVYHPIASATNIPVMFYQEGRRGNRWQLDRTLEKLEQGGAAVYLKILPDVTGVFYDEDMAAETFAVLKKLPVELPKVIAMLDKAPTPADTITMAATSNKGGTGLDQSLKPFSGGFRPIPIRLPSSSGEEVEITDFTGKVTVVNFWASWCRPCVKEIPALNRLRKRMQGRAFDLVSINYAEKPEQIREFLNMVNVDFPVLLDEDGRYTARWKVLVYPSTFVVSPEGRIVYGVNGAIEWDSDGVIADLKAILPD